MMPRCKKTFRSSFVNFGAGSGGSGGNAVQPQTFADLGVEPEFAVNFGLFNGPGTIGTTVANKNTTSGYGDAEITTALTATYQNPVSGASPESGGQGYTKNALNLGQFQLPSSGHSISTGPFCWVIWNALSYGTASASGSLSFVGNGGATRMFIQSTTVSTLTLNNQASTFSWTGYKTGMAKNMLLIQRLNDGNVQFWINGVLAWEPGINAGNIASFPFFIATAALRHTVIAAHLFDQSLTPEQIESYWNKGVGTFWEAPA